MPFSGKPKSLFSKFSVPIVLPLWRTFSQTNQISFISISDKPPTTPFTPLIKESADGFSKYVKKDSLYRLAPISRTIWSPSVNTGSRSPLQEGGSIPIERGKR